MSKTIVDVIERSGWTFVQAAFAAVTAPELFGTNVDWRVILSTGLIAGLVAVLKTLGLKASQITAANDAVQAVIAHAPASVTGSTPLQAVVRTSEEIAAEVARKSTESK